ncbi:DUF7287 family protein [Halopiger aswanensis]|uniref:Uncharacterized protein n=1 Tax=Halopiger aswanensis TaxID=148449 RepID=A0A3R7KNC0_9EURY|nr:hypothetical protein [Halopiger aswanensis]RKD97854.1 hypothetical protein ATJ93_0851 [Halopiger aswanensis]
MTARSRPRPRDGRSKRTRRKRPRTVSISLADRGQTTQDFAIGIGVFILAVAFVFSFLPSIVTPYDSSVGGAETAQADRIADRVVQNLSTGESPNEIDETPIVTGAWNESQLATRTGLRTTTTGGGDTVLIDKANVTIQHLNGSTVEHTTVDGVGPAYEDQPAASSARIVALKDDSDDFDEPAYRLLVRVW